MIEDCKLLIEEKTSKKGDKYTCVTIIFPDGCRVSVLDQRLENAILRARLSRVDK